MMERFVVGLSVWSLVCAVVAIPSWILSRDASVGGKVVGIGAWVMLYALATSTEAFARRWRLRRERTAIMYAYGLRVLLSTVGMFLPAAMIADLYCGIIAVGIVQNLTGIDVIGNPNAIAATAATTFLQGLFLSVLTLIALQVIRAICLNVMKPDTIENKQRGFEVLPLSPRD